MVASRRAFLRRALALGASAPVAAAAPAVLLSACTGDDGQGDGQAPASGRTSVPTRKFRGRIVVATLQNPPIEAKDALTAAYREFQPGVDIVWDTRNYTDEDNYADWLGDELAADRIRPDIVSGNHQPGFGGYTDLDEYRQSTNPYTGHPWSDDYRFDLYRGTEPAGRRRLIGTEGRHLFWYYNEAILSDVGVAPPTNWDELVDVAGQLLAAGYQPLSVDFDTMVIDWFASTYFDQYHNDWVETVRAQKGDWSWDPERDATFAFDPQDPLLHTRYTYSPQRFFRGLRDRRLRFDTPAVAEVVSNFTRVFPQFAGVDDFFVRNDQYTPFLLQQAAMMVDGSESLTALHQDLGSPTPERLRELGVDADSIEPFDWEVFEFPPMQGPLVQSNVRPAGSPSGYELCVVDKSRDRTDMVVDFLMFWTSRPGYGVFVDALVDADRLDPKGPSLVRGVQYPSDIQDLLAKIEQQRVAGPPYGRLWVDGAGGRTRDDLRDLFRRILRRDLTPDDYAARVQSYVEREFDQLLALSALTEDDILYPERRPPSV